MRKEDGQIIQSDGNGIQIKEGVNRMLHIGDGSIEVDGEAMKIMSEVMCLTQAVYEEVIRIIGKPIADKWLISLPYSVMDTYERMPMSENLFNEEEDDPYLKMLGEDNNDY